MNWRKYGYILISAGISVTGSFWFLRQNPAIRGEDAAECLAAMTERAAIGYLRGTNTPAFNSNTVDSARCWSAVYQALDGARTLAGGVGNFYALVDAFPEGAYSDTTVLWLDADDAEPEEGDVIALQNGLHCWETVSQTNWYVNGSGNLVAHVSTQWNLVYGTNATGVELLNTTQTRVPGAMCRFMPLVSGTNLPIVTKLYGWDSDFTDWSYVWTNAVRTNNWWNKVGVSSNVYKYGCEKYSGDKASILIAYGSGYQVLTNELDYPYLDWPKALSTAVAETSASNFTGAAAIKIMAEGRRDGWLAVADAYIGHPPAATYDHGTSDAKRLFEITSGESVIFDVLPHPFTPGQNRTITFTGLGCSVSPASYSWSTLYTKRPVTVTLSSGAAVVKMSESGQPDGYVAVINSSGLNADWIVSPDKSSVPVGGLASISIQPASIKTNTTVSTRQTITTNDLDEVRAVLKNLKRTIYIGLPSGLTVSNAMHYTGGHNSIDSLSDQEGTAPECDGYAYLLAQAGSVAEISAAVDDPADFGGYFNTSFTFARYAISGGFSSYQWFDGDSWNHNVDRQSAFYYETKEWLGCRAPYPSDWACKTGAVKKVTVFVCAASGSQPDIPTPYVASTNDNSRCTFVDGGCQGLSDYVFNLFNVAVTSPSPLTNAFQATAALFDSADSFLHSEPFQYTLSKIGEWNIPAASPVFDIGARALSVPLDKPANWNDWIIDDDDYEAISERWSYSYAQEVYLRLIVVVVDWDWDHLNPDHAFEPEPYTPEWVTANTNAP